MNALTSTRSPIVIVPATTPTVARHMISVTATAMMALCVTLRNDSDVWLLTAAFSQRCMLSS
mgnify:CR=1 FL=1